MYKKRLVDIPLYHTRLLLLLTDSKPKLQSLGIEIEDDIPYANSSRLYYKGYATVVIQLNPNYPDWKLTHSTVAHEVLHTTNNVLERIGQKPDRNNDEADCYLAAWITTQVYQFLEDSNVQLHINH